MTPEELKKLADDLKAAIAASREKYEKLEEKYDSGDFEAMKKSDAVIAELSEKISKFQVAHDAQEKVNAEIDAVKEQQAILAASIGKTDEKTDEEEKSESMKHLDGMLRRSESYANYSKYQEDVAKRLVDKEFSHTEESDREGIRKEMLSGSNPDGGYFVPTEFGMTIMGQVYETSAVRPYCSTVTSMTSEIQFPLDDKQADAGWIGETAERDVTDTPEMGIIRIPVHELFASPQATQKLLEDAGINIATWLAGKVSRRFGRLENTAFVKGDGALKPNGFLSYPEWTTPGVYQRNAVERVNSGVAMDFNADSFKTLCGRLKQEYMMGAIWGMKRIVWTDVTKLKDNQGRYLFEMNRNFKDGDTLQILGKKVVLMDDMPEKAANSNSVIFGDFMEGYTIVDRLGIRMLRDAYTAKPFVKFYTTKRVGGAVTNYEALKIMKLAA